MNLCEYLFILGPFGNSCLALREAQARHLLSLSQFSPVVVRHDKTPKNIALPLAYDKPENRDVCLCFKSKYTGRLLAAFLSGVTLFLASIVYFLSKITIRTKYIVNNQTTLPANGV